MLALDSNNLQAFSTLAFIYYDMNMLEMAKLVGNQAIAKADEIATGKFDEEKVEEAAEGKAGKGKKGKKEKKESGGDDSEDGKLAKEVNVREEGTGVTAEMKKNLAVVYNTLGLVELKKKNISPAISQFKKAVEMNPKLARGAPQPGGAVAQQPRLQHRGGELPRGARAAAEELRGRDRSRRRAAREQEDRRGRGAVQRRRRSSNPSNPSSYFNLGLLYQDYKDGQKPTLHKAQDYYRQFLGHANDKTPDVLQEGGREAHQGHRRNLRRPRRGRQDAGRGRGDAEEGRRAAEADGRADEEAGGRRGRCAAAKAKEAGAKADGAAPTAPGRRRRRLPGPTAPAGDADKAAAAAAPADDQALAARRRRRRSKPPPDVSQRKEDRKRQGHQSSAALHSGDDARGDPPQRSMSSDLVDSLEPAEPSVV